MLCVAEKTHDTTFQKKIILLQVSVNRETFYLCTFTSVKNKIHVVVINITLLKTLLKTKWILCQSIYSLIVKCKNNIQKQDSTISNPLLSCEGDSLFATFCQPTHGSCRSLRPLVSCPASCSNPPHPRSLGNDHSSQLPKQHGRPSWLVTLLGQTSRSHILFRAASLVCFCPRLSPEGEMFARALNTVYQAAGEPFFTFLVSQTARRSSSVPFHPRLFARSWRMARALHSSGVVSVFQRDTTRCRMCALCNVFNTINVKLKGFCNPLYFAVVSLMLQWKTE